MAAATQCRLAIIEVDRAMVRYPQQKMVQIFSDPDNGTPWTGQLQLRSQTKRFRE